MRCFVAVDVNEKVRKNIWDIAKHLGDKAVKQVKQEHYHITLDFLGDVSEKYAVKIGRGIDNLDIEPFDIVFKGIGVFPNMSYIKIIWVGTNNKSNSKFKELVKKMDKKTGKERKKPFHPHVTIGRVKKKPSKKVKDLIKESSDVRFGKQTVNQITVKKSKLTPEGPIYTNLTLSQLKKYVENQGK